jgi:uncharacterized protein
VEHSGTWMKVLLAIALIGAINWGLIGLFNFNLVDALLGGGSREETSTLSRIVYALVGLSGLVTVFMLPRLRYYEAQRPRRVEARP